MGIKMEQGVEKLAKIGEGDLMASFGSLLGFKAFCPLRIPSASAMIVGWRCYIKCERHKMPLRVLVELSRQRKVKE